MKLDRNVIMVRGKETVFWQGGKKSGDVMVLLHGFPGNHQGLVDLAKSLSENFSVIIPDLPACGASQDSLKTHTQHQMTSVLCGHNQTRNT